MKKMDKILIVDDEADFRNSCSRLLAGRGYDVAIAENGLVALEIIDKENPHLVLLDLKMPVMSGDEALEIIHEKYPHLPVIMLTGHGDITNSVACMKRGAYDFLTKPFDTDYFLMTVTRAVEKNKLEAKARLFHEEYKKNLYDLNIEKSRLRTIVGYIPNGVMVTNMNMEVVLLNPALKRLLSIHNELTTPVPIEKVLNDESFIKSLKDFQSSNHKENEFISHEIHTDDKILRSISAVAFEPDREVFWKIAGTVTVIEDITLFRQIDRMKSDFINMVTHELRSPLAAIRQINTTFIDGLTGPLNEKQKDFIKRVISKTDGLLELINDLLNMAKMESSTNIEQETSTDIAYIIDEIVTIIRPQATSQNVEIAFTSHNLKPIKADTKKIELLINNLISNAVKYSPDGGIVNIFSKIENDTLEISVEDHGIGIPIEEQTKIFNRFYRVKNPKTRKVTGTGLGLSMVREIVESLGGKIWVKSIPDKGTTFTLTIPITL